MFHFEREPSSQSTVPSQKATLSRRGSVPQLYSSSEFSTLQYRSIPALRRAPLAPLDPQTTQVTLTVIDDQMAASSPFFGYADTAQGPQRPVDLLCYNAGRSNVPSRSACDGAELGVPPARRRSIPNQYASR